MTEPVTLQPPAEWLRAQFEFEWCPDCGRDHRHHTAIPSPFGHWFARCDREPVFTCSGELIPNPEAYPEKED